MRAVVLVGGFGTRLWPLTLTTPKQMLPVVDRPMVEWVVDQVVRHGIDDVVLSLGYRRDAFQEAYPDARCAGATLHYAVEPEPLGTAGAIRFAAERAGVDERFVVVNGDVLTDLDLGRLIRFHDAHGGEATIALHEVDDPSHFGVVVTDSDGRVDAFVEKPPPGEAPSNLINAGIYVLEPSVVKRIPPGRAVSIERETFPALATDEALWALDDGGVYWRDTGTPEHYLQVQLDLVDRIRPMRVVAVDPSAQIDADAFVSRAVIGPGVVVERGAKVCDAAVLEGARIGADARVANAIVGSHAVIGPGAVVADGTVIGMGATVDSHTTVRAAKVPDPDLVGR
ncbi:MAG: sugar phosphate nucleotidyltransferase [Acidimicrobiales bacterium]